MRKQIQRKKQGGFTLVELMIAVVIAGILAAIAIPAFAGLSRKAKVSEVPTMLASIATAQELRKSSEVGTYWLPSHSFPTTGTPSATKLSWSTAELAEIGAALDVAPTGSTIARYGFAGCPAGFSGGYAMAAVTDADADGKQQIHFYGKPCNKVEAGVTTYTHGDWVAAATAAGYAGPTLAIPTSTPGCADAAGIDGQVTGVVCAAFLDTF